MDRTRPGVPSGTVADNILQYSMVWYILWYDNKVDDNDDETDDDSNADDVDTDANDCDNDDNDDIDDNVDNTDNDDTDDNDEARGFIFWWFLRILRTWEPVLAFSPIAFGILVYNEPVL